MEIRVTDTTFYRDTNNKALINRDSAGLEDYKMKRRLLETQKHEINMVKQEIQSIKGDMSEIKQMILKLMDKGSNG